MKSFAEFISEDHIPLKKTYIPGSKVPDGYHGHHEGQPIHVYKTVHHTDTSRPSRRADQRAGYGSYASSRKDTVWNWRSGEGPKHDGYGSKKQALDHIRDMAKRKVGPWAPKG